MTKLHCLHTFRLGNSDAAIVNWYDIVDTEIVSPQLTADEISGNYLAEMHQDATSVHCVYTGCTLTDENKTFKVVSPRNDAGVATGGMTPPNCAYLLRHNLIGTTNSGRNYLPGVPEAAVGDFGEVTAGTLAYINTQWAAYIGKLVAAYPSFQLNVKTKGNVFKGVQASNCDSLLATQRRRLRT